MQRIKTVPTTTITEQIYSYEVYPQSNIVRVTTLEGVLPEGETLLNPHTSKMVVTEITEGLCSDLLSDNPSWGTGKPANYFKELDLWDAIDAGKAESTIAEIVTARGVK